MAIPTRDDRRSNGETVYVAGRHIPVIGRISLHRRIYFLLEQLRSSDTRRYMAFDPRAGPGGDLRAIHVLPYLRGTWQQFAVLKRLSHDAINLPTIVDYERQRNRVFVVLTWVNGPTLERYLQAVRQGRRRRPSVVESLRVFRGLAHGLSRLHQKRQIVHGDIKPANLILASNPSRLVMIDFGSAWLVERTTSRDEGDGVTAAYAAPELQAGRNAVDFRSDQFSASVIFYELLTLRLPYDGLGGKAGRPEFAARMAKKLVPPSRLNRNRLPLALRRAIDRLAMTGLHLESDSRYPSPSVWLDAVNEAYAETFVRTRLNPVSSWLTSLLANLVRTK